jgi:hypothetical protein
VVWSAVFDVVVIRESVRCGRDIGFLYSPFIPLNRRIVRVETPNSWASIAFVFLGTPSIGFDTAIKASICSFESFVGLWGRPSWKYSSLSVGLTSGLYPRFLASLIMYWLFLLDTSQFFDILETVATIFQGNSLSTGCKWEKHCCLSN